MTRAAIVLLAGWFATGAHHVIQGGQCDVPLTESAISQLLADGVPAAGIRRLISSCGIDLGLATSDATESRLKQLGVPTAALTALAPPPATSPGSTWVSPYDRRPMVFVPAGKFRMGSETAEADRDEDERQHDVAVTNSFWMDAGEVTNDAYRRFVLSRPEWQKHGTNPELKGSNYLKTWQGTSYPEGLGDSPVVWVTWHAARAYAAWAGKRLPTEAEWEYAIRAGTTTIFWWGSIFTPERTVSTDMSFRTNPWGIRDGTGGVWEWTSSLYRSYPYVSTDGREDARATGARSVRGGSWVNGEAFMRSANRNSEEAVTASDLLGFRCAR